MSDDISSTTFEKPDSPARWQFCSQLMKQLHTASGSCWISISISQSQICWSHREGFIHLIFLSTAEQSCETSLLTFNDAACYVLWRCRNRCALFRGNWRPSHILPCQRLSCVLISSVGRGAAKPVQKSANAEVFSSTRV